MVAPIDGSVKSRSVVGGDRPNRRHEDRRQARAGVAAEPKRRCGRTKYDVCAIVAARVEDDRATNSILLCEAEAPLEALIQPRKQNRPKLTRKSVGARFTARTQKLLEMAATDDEVLQKREIG
jgi:hypothetical protein